MPPNTSTKEDLLQAACLIFAEHGYDATNVRRIAEAAKVSLGSLHYHFKNKEVLYTEVLRTLYDLDNALTIDVLLEQEPNVLDTPDGNAYAIHRIVVDYFQRHVFTAEQWREKLIRKELETGSKMYLRIVELVVKEEWDKLTEFYYRLRPDGTEIEAFYWTHLPDMHGLYYFMADDMMNRHLSKKAKADMNATVITNTARIMIGLLNLPIPPMLKS